jgi:hypothetical protein
MKTLKITALLLFCAAGVLLNGCAASANVGPARLSGHAGIDGVGVHGRAGDAAKFGVEIIP